MPQEDNENFYCPGKKSLYRSLVDTHPVHVKMHPVLKQKYFSGGGKFSWDTRMMCTKRTIKRLCVLPTLCDLVFCPHLIYPSWSNKRSLEFMWQGLWCTGEVTAAPAPNFRQGLLLQSVDTTYPQLLAAQHPRRMASGQKIPSLLESWEKAWWLQETFLNCKCGLE